MQSLRCVFPSIALSLVRHCSFLRLCSLFHTHSLSFDSFTLVFFLLSFWNMFLPPFFFFFFYIREITINLDHLILHAREHIFLFIIITFSSFFSNYLLSPTVEKELASLRVTGGPPSVVRRTARTWYIGSCYFASQRITLTDRHWFSSFFL